MAPQIPSRPFSIAARVYPTPPAFYAAPSQQPVVQQLAKPRMARLGRWAIPAVGLAVLGFAAQQQLENGRLAPRKAEAMAQQLDEMEKNRKMLDAFADRGSLADLEKAMEAYDVK